MIFDIAVVGGGPVGLAAAIEGRLVGLSVVIVEQRTGAIDKACGEGLMPGAVPLLQRLGVSPDGHPLRGVTYLQGTRSVTHRFADGGGRGVRRTTLHTSLRERVNELGVARVEGKVTAVDLLGSSADGAIVRTAEGHSVQARYVLACDGLHSTVARLTGLVLPPPRRKRRYGVRQHYFVAPWSDNIEVFYAKKAEIYVTPVSDRIVGLSMLGAKGTNYDEILASVPELAARVDGAAPASERRGAGPFRQRRSARTAGPVLLVGDASGYVDAITGEGLRLGFAQAREAVRCVVANDPAAYERAWKATTRDFRVLTGGLVALATSPLRPTIVPIAATLPKLFGVIVERLAR